MSRLQNINEMALTISDLKREILTFCSAVEGLTKCQQHWSDLQALAFSFDEELSEFRRDSDLPRQMDAFFGPMADLLTAEHSRCLQRAGYDERAHRSDAVSAQELVVRPARAIRYALKFSSSLEPDADEECIYYIGETRVRLQWYVENVRAGLDSWTAAEMRAFFGEMRRVTATVGVMGVFLASVVYGVEFESGREWGVNFKSSIGSPIKIEVTVPVLSSEARDVAPLAMCTATALMVQDSLGQSATSVLNEVEIGAYRPPMERFSEYRYPSVEPWRDFGGDRARPNGPLFRDPDESGRFDRSSGPIERDSHGVDSEAADERRRNDIGTGLYRRLPSSHVDPQRDGRPPRNGGGPSGRGRASGPRGPRGR